MSALVAYASSEDSETDSERGRLPPSNCRRLNETPSKQAPHKLPPLPTAFHDLYATNIRLSTDDDPSLHDGRKRQVPHLDGHWPTHVYLEWRPDAVQHRILSELVTAAAEEVVPSTRTTDIKGILSTANRNGEGGISVHSLLETPYSTPAPLHISLSRTLSPTTAERAPFLEAITKAIQSSRSLKGAFNVDFGEVNWFSNYEENRWFLALAAKKPPGDELNHLLKACNSAVKGFGWEELYVDQQVGGRRTIGAEDSETNDAEKQLKESTTLSNEERDYSRYFHVSLAWALRQPPNRTTLPKPQNELSVRFSAVKVKIGNTIHSIAMNGSKTS